MQGASWDRAKRKFHIHDPTPPPLSTAICSADVEGLHELLSSISNPAQAQATGSYAVFNDATCSLVVLPSVTTTKTVLLRPAESDMITVVPVLGLEVAAAAAGNGCNTIGSAAGGSYVRFAPIGLINMMNPAGAIKAYSIINPTTEVLLSPDDDSAATATAAAAGKEHVRSSSVLSPAGPQLELVVKGHGSFLLYCSRPPATVLLNGKDVEYQYDRFDATVLVQIPAYCGSLVNTLLLQL